MSSETKRQPSISKQPRKIAPMVLGGMLWNSQGWHTKEISDRYQGMMSNMRKPALNILVEKYDYNTKERWIQVMHVTMLRIQDEVIQYADKVEKELKRLFFPNKEELPKQAKEELINLLRQNFQSNVPFEEILKSVLMSDEWPLLSNIPIECVLFFKELVILSWAMNLYSHPIRMLSFDDHPEWYDVDGWAKKRSFPGLLFFIYPALIGIEGGVVAQGMIAPLAV